jgi:hypothetical protein
MPCVKNVTSQAADQVPFEYESARPGPDLADDPSDAPDDDAEVPEEAGYGYGV